MNFINYSSSNALAFNIMFIFVGNKSFSNAIAFIIMLIFVGKNGPIMEELVGNLKMII